MEINIGELIKAKEYEFLWENEHLKNKLIFLTLGGSHSYGTNIEGSDIDIRGCAFNSASDLLGMSTFEQFCDNDTDTNVFAFNKFIKLLCDCNPAIIEMLGCKPEHYVFFDETGRELVSNRKMFLSQRAVDSFAGYANQQLRRLECALAHDRLGEDDKERHLVGSMNRAVASFKSRYEDFEHGSIKLFADTSNKENRETEVFADINLKRYPVRDFNAIMNELTSIAKTYDKLNNRNKKKDEAHLNKHAMHLVRLYLMAFDLLENGEINTYRENDRGMLLDIRNGKYMNADGTYLPEFFEIVNKYEKRLEYDKKNTILPSRPDMKKVEEFVMEVNKKAINK